jgi:16S rRNA (guanine966-N2)-methyltransferase
MLPPRRSPPAKTAALSRLTTPGKVRIIAGSLRNSRLAVPDLPGLRPTAERVRETLFNWLAPHLPGARCLDLFAGTGALGIEAASRGAESVMMVERDASLAAALRANLLRLKVGAAQVENADALAYLDRADGAFDLVFLDPPFAYDLWTPAAQRLQQRGLLRPGALVYVESPLTIAPEMPADWSLHREGRGGEVRYVVYRTPSSP